MSDARVIVLRGDPIQKEAKAAGVMQPGDLIERTTTGELQRHSTAGGFAERLFATERPGASLSTGAYSLETPFAVGDTTPYVVARPGDEVSVTVNAGTPAIAKSALLVSDGAGGVMADELGVSGATYESGYPIPGFWGPEVIGRALEALDNSAGTARRRIAMEVR